MNFTLIKYFIRTCATSYTTNSLYVSCESTPLIFSSSFGITSPLSNTYPLMHTPHSYPSISLFRGSQCVLPTPHTLW